MSKGWIGLWIRIRTSRMFWIQIPVMSTGKGSKLLRMMRNCSVNHACIMWVFFFDVGPAAIPHRVQHRLQGPHQHGPHHQVGFRDLTQLPYTIIFASVQCCGSGIRCFFSGIQCLFTPGSGMGETSRSGSEIRTEHPGSYFREPRNILLG